VIEVVRSAGQRTAEIYAKCTFLKPIESAESENFGPLCTNCIHGKHLADVFEPFACPGPFHRNLRHAPNPEEIATRVRDVSAANRARLRRMVVATVIKAIPILVITLGVFLLLL
jgi:hypothetical protein